MVSQNPQGKYLAVRLGGIPPGTDLDGTRYASKSCVAAQWTRFFQGVPSKILGYKSVDRGDDQIVTNMYSVDLAEGSQLMCGRQTGLKFVALDNEGNNQGVNDITPSGWGPPDFNRSWSFDELSVLGDEGPIRFFLAAATYNNANISEREEGQVYYGVVNNLTSTGPMLPLVDLDSTPTPNRLIKTSGGILATPTFAIVYGNDGVFYWSRPGSLAVWTENDVRNRGLLKGGTKIIYGALVPGSTDTSVIFWQTNRLSRVTFLPNTSGSGSSLTVQIQNYDDKISILSANCVVSYNQTFYWIGQGQIYSFAGVIKVVPNSQCGNTFFNELDPQFTSRMWALVQPRYGEIWWYYVSRNSPNGQCDSVLVQDILGGSFTITRLARSSGVQLSQPPYPYLWSATLETIPTTSGSQTVYPLWQHEIGFDKVLENKTTPILSYFEYKIIDLFTDNPNLNNLILFRRMQPDFTQKGKMSLVIKGEMAPAEDAINYGPYYFEPNTKYIDLDTPQVALASFRFESNDLGGYFRMGTPIFEYDVGDNLR